MLSNSENTTFKGNSKSSFWSLPKLGHFSCSNELQPHTGAEPGSSEDRHNVTLIVKFTCKSFGCVRKEQRL